MADADYPLGSLGHQIEDHWKQHRPKMYADLERVGELRQSVHAAQELTGEALYDLTVVKKVPHDQAWELVKEEWAFLPTEEDVPELGFDPTQLRAQLPGISASRTRMPSGRGPSAPRPNRTLRRSDSSKSSNPKTGRRLPKNRPS